MSSACPSIERASHTSDAVDTRVKKRSDAVDTSFLYDMHGAIVAENGATLALRKLLKRRKIVNVSV